jgi:cation diffusion facilitator family transporter
LGRYVVVRINRTGNSGMAAHAGPRRVIYAALVGNLLIALTKFGAAAYTGSSAMLSEGIHSLVDTGNGLLLLYGLRQAARPPDALHQLGHGRELYFWSFIVALMVFAVGAGVSFYEGVIHILEPRHATNLLINYVVLALSVAFEGYSWRVALKEFRQTKGKLGYFAAVRQSKDPSVFTVLFEDSAALIGLAIAFIGISAAAYFDQPVLDGVASLGIAAVLGATAIFLARESKALLLGEAATPAVQQAILQIVRADAEVRTVNGMTTVHLGPNEIVLALSLEFEDDLTTTAIEASVARIEKLIRAAEPAVTSVFIKPQTASSQRRSSEENSS